MSMQSVQTIIIRAVFEGEYRNLLFDDLARALNEYDLTTMEIEWLRRLSRVEFEGFAPELEKDLIEEGMQCVNTSHTQQKNASPF
jgi:hypothetical protein